MTGRSSLVSADWLAARRDAVVVLDASIARRTDASGATRYEIGDESFAAGHIPGARFADLVSTFSDPSAPFPFTCPTAAQIEAAARSVGIGRDSTVVVYDSLNGAWAARLWWVLRAFGCERVFVLDGGLAAWQRGGGSIEIGPAAPVPPGDFEARPQAGFFVDLAAVKAIVAARSADAALVCGTRRSEYVGDEGGGARPGHIPDSVSLPYPELLDAAGQVDVARARSVARALHLEARRQVVLYCGGGINAAGLALAFTAAGLEGMTVFDGSLNEWRADPTLPLELGE